MNNNLLQINDTFGVVSDEHGNLGVISKDNNKYSFEDILKEENELEVLKKEEKSLATKMSAIKIYSFLANIICFMGLLLTLFATYHSGYSFKSAFLISYVPLKIASFIVINPDAGFESLFRIGRIISFHRCKKKVNVLNKEISKLEKDLRDKKMTSLFLDGKIDLLFTSITQDRLHKSVDNMKLVDLKDKNNRPIFAFKDCTGNPPYVVNPKRNNMRRVRKKQN